MTPRGRQRSAAGGGDMLHLPLAHQAGAIVSQADASALARPTGCKSVLRSVRDLTPEILRQI